MRIVVYDVAADSGGALSVLMDYYTCAIADSENEYLFIVSVVQLEEVNNVKVYRAPQVKKSWASRLAFDIFRAHKIIDGFDADEVISLQNMIVPFVNRKQAVYMHNLLPKQICDLKFSLFKEPKMWLYQNIIGQLIIHSLKWADEIIVQTHWLAKRCSVRCGIPLDKFRIKRPSISINAPAAAKLPVQDKIFLYPASGEVFKNHEVIFEAGRLLKQKGVNNYKVLLTLKGNENRRIAALKAESEQLDLPVYFVGWLSSEEMIRTYERSFCLLFPSKLETLGFPLEEAKAFGLGIIAADLEYAHETIGTYSRADYFDPDEAMKLAKIIEAKVCVVNC